MLQAQQQRKMAQKCATHTPVTSAPASAAPSEDGTTPQNLMTAETSSTHVVPDTDADSDSDMPARQPSVATASHDSDTEVCSLLHVSCMTNYALNAELTYILGMRAFKRLNDNYRLNL